LIANAPSSVAEKDAREPPKEPMGVRTAAAMQTSACRQQQGLRAGMRVVETGTHVCAECTSLGATTTAVEHTHTHTVSPLGLRLDLSTMVAK
jgi:hypothetical protein